MALREVTWEEAKQTAAQWAAQAIADDVRRRASVLENPKGIASRSEVLQANWAKYKTAMTWIADDLAASATKGEVQREEGGQG